MSSNFIQSLLFFFGCESILLGYFCFFSDPFSLKSLRLLLLTLLFFSLKRFGFGFESRDFGETLLFLLSFFLLTDALCLCSFSL